MFNTRARYIGQFSPLIKGLDVGKMYYLKVHGSKYIETKNLNMTPRLDINVFINGDYLNNESYSGKYLACSFYISIDDIINDWEFVDAAINCAAEEDIIETSLMNIINRDIKINNLLD